MCVLKLNKIISFNENKKHSKGWKDDNDHNLIWGGGRREWGDVFTILCTDLSACKLDWRPGGLEAWRPGGLEAWRPLDKGCLRIVPTRG